MMEKINQFAKWHFNQVISININTFSLTIQFEIYLA